MIDGLGPTELIEPGDLPLLASKVRAAQDRDAEMSRRPDLPPDDDAWIRQIQRMPAARLVPGLSGDAAFGDRIATRAGPRAKVEWFVAGCGHRGHHGGPPVDLTGDKDESGVCRRRSRGSQGQRAHGSGGSAPVERGCGGKPVASKAQLYDKRPGHIHIENVSLDVLETKLGAIRAPLSEAPLSK